MARQKKQNTTTISQRNIRYNTNTQDKPTQQTKDVMHAPRPVNKTEKPKALPRSQKK